MAILDRFVTLSRRRRAAKEFGISFRGMRNIALPTEARIGGQNLALSFPDDRFLAYEMVSLWFDDEYGLRELPEPLHKVLDVGANVGLFTLKVKNMFPGAVVHSYEPDEASAVHFRRNAERLEAVEFFLEGVSDRSGSAEILRSDSTRLTQTSKTDDGSGSITLAGLDDVMQRIGGGVDLMKIDCEGGEWEIMNNRPAIREAAKIRMEYHLWGGKTISDLRRLAEDIGFEITFLSQDGDIGFAYLERT